MKLLIIDTTTEFQARCAQKLEMVSQSDIEMLDLKVKLASDTEYAERLNEADVIVLGAGLDHKAISIARHCNSLAPWIHIILFVTDEGYGGGAFRAAHSVGVRKVFPDSASSLDFLQELVAIHAEFRREGRAREGKIIAFTHAKGGVGATTLTAAIGEVCSLYNKRTLLWDMDVETRDLSRSLTVNGVESKIVSSWVNGSREISRESLKDAVTAISSDVSVLMPPDRMAESMDLVCHTDGMGIAQRVVELSRVLFDVVLVDTGGRLGPATGTLLRMADVVVVVIDDTILGLTAVDLYLSFIKNLLGGSLDRVVFITNPFSGSMLGVSQIAAELEPAHHLGDSAWRLPPIPFDKKASLWPGSGKTLYSMGQKSTRQVLEHITNELGLSEASTEHLDSNSDPQGAGKGGGGLIKKLLGR